MMYLCSLALGPKTHTQTHADTQVRNTVHEEKEWERGRDDVAKAISAWYN